jgi:signal transduction histidine kinase
MASRTPTQTALEPRAGALGPRGDSASGPARGRRPETLPSAGGRTHLIDVALAIVAFAAAVALLGAGEEEAGRSMGALDVLIVALASLPLAAWRRAPLAVFVFTTAASSTLLAVAEPAGPPVGPTIAVYLVGFAGDGSPSRTRLSLAVVAVMLAVHLVAGGIEGAEILFGIPVWGAAWLAGDRTRLRRERMAELEERAVRAEREAERERRLAAAEERGRIARDLHDSAGHAINVILVHAGMGRLQTERDPERAREAFATIEEVARETVGEIDQMVRVLREDASLDGEVEPPAGLASLEGLVERHRAAGLDVTSTVYGERRPLPAAVDGGAYRIIREALTNAARHGNGNARVQIAFGEREVELFVENVLVPGRPAGSEGGGHGLVGMRERAALLGGSLEAGPHEGRFEVRARLPIPEDHA